MDRESLFFQTYPQLHGLEAVFARHVRHAVSRHAHSRFCAVFVEHGVRRMHVAGQVHDVRAGHGIVVRPQAVHACDSLDGSECSYTTYCLGDEVLLSLAHGLGLDFRAVSATASGLVDTRGFTAAMQLKECLWDEARGEQAQDWLTTLGAELFNGGVENPPPEKEAFSRMVGQVKECMELRYAEPLGLSDLAELAGCEPQSLCRLFARHVGLPPHAYLNQVRVNASRIVLAEGGSLVQAAYSSGFVDQSHFCKVFKRLVGMTPGQYQKGLRGD